MLQDSLDIDYPYYADLWDLILSPLHFGLRGVDGLIKLSGYLAIGGPVCYEALRHLYDKRIEEIQQAYLTREGHKKLYIKFVLPDGGNTINGWQFFWLGTVHKLISKFLSLF